MPVKQANAYVKEVWDYRQKNFIKNQIKSSYEQLRNRFHCYAGAV